MSKARKWAIEPYFGYGTSDRLIVQGRVLNYTRVIESHPTDSRWRNLSNMWKRFATRDVPNARVRARHGNRESLAVSDREGYFTIELSPGAPSEDRPWHEVLVDLPDVPRSSGVSEVAAQVLVPPAHARFGVISDIDDTVVRTNVGSTLAMLATVLLSNSHARTPLAGIAALYRAFHDGAGGGEANPIFYVSNGPWNLHGLLVEFFKLNRIPLGPLLLRDFGPRLMLGGRRQPSQKLENIRKILALYPALPFILIGDSTERDPEIYCDVVQRFPDRVLAIYIRSMDPRPERLSAIAALANAIRSSRTQFVLVPDTESAAVHAIGEGLIPSSTLEAVRNEKS